MRRRVIILMVTVLSLPCHALTLDELADILEEMESAIEDVTIEYEWYNEKELTEQDVNNPGFLAPVSRAACTFTTAKPFTELQAYSEKVDLSQGPGTTFSLDLRYTYDGELFRQLSLRSLHEHPPEGFVTKRTDLLRTWNSTPMAFTIFRFYPEGLLSQGLREHPESFRLVDGIQQIRDFRTIELDSVTDMGVAHTKMFLSVDHGYALVRFEYVSPTNGALEIAVDVQTLQEVADGLWFPFKGTSDIPGEDNGSVFEVRNVTLNQNLSKDDFNLAFPPGTEVSDETAWWPKINLAILSPREVAGVLLLLVALAVLVLYRTARRRSPS
jgi:hypothetical protein